MDNPNFGDNFDDLDPSEDIDFDAIWDDDPPADMDDMWEPDAPLARAEFLSAQPDDDEDEEDIPPEFLQPARPRGIFNPNAPAENLPSLTRPLPPIQPESPLPASPPVEDAPLHITRPRPSLFSAMPDAADDDSEDEDDLLDFGDDDDDFDEIDLAEDDEDDDSDDIGEDETAEEEPSPAPVPPSLPLTQNRPEPPQPPSRFEPDRLPHITRPEPIPPIQPVQPLTEPEAPPVYHYQVSLVLPSDIIRYVDQMRQSMELPALPIGNFAMIAPFTTQDIEAVQSHIEAWARHHLPMQFSIIDLAAEVIGAQRYRLGLEVDASDQLADAQVALSQALGDSIQMVAAEPDPFAAQIPIADHTPAPKFPHLIHAVQNSLPRLDWTLDSVELLQVPEGDQRWEVLAKIRP